MIQGITNIETKEREVQQRNSASSKKRRYLQRFSSTPRALQISQCTKVSNSFACHLHTSILMNTRLGTLKYDPLSKFFKKVGDGKAYLKIVKRDGTESGDESTRSKDEL